MAVLLGDAKETNTMERVDTYEKMFEKEVAESEAIVSAATALMDEFTPEDWTIVSESLVGSKEHFETIIHNIRPLPSSKFRESVKLGAEAGLRRIEEIQEKITKMKSFTENSICSICGHLRFELPHYCPSEASKPSDDSEQNKTALREDIRKADYKRIAEERYLGDGLYAKYDGWHVVLGTHSYVEEVYLDPEVIRNFNKYVQEIESVIHKRDKDSGRDKSK